MPAGLAAPLQPALLRALRPLLAAWAPAAAWPAWGGPPRCMSSAAGSSSSDSDSESPSSAAAAAAASGTDSDAGDELGPAEVAELAALQADAAALAGLLGGGDGDSNRAPTAAELAELDALLGMPPPDDAEPEVPPEAQRLLQAGVVGAPNAGKSTLVNCLVGAKVSAVSPKTNTTEQSRLGAFTFGASQVVLYDTPGVVDSKHYKNPAHQRRVRGAWTVAGDCDLLLFLVDAARELQRPDPRIHRLLADSCAAAALGLPASWEPPPAVLVLNKCDLVPREARSQLLPLTDRLKGLRGFEDVFYVSAKDGRGVPELRQYLLERATPGEWALEAGMTTDRGEDEQALEAVREQLFLRLYKELPYAARLRLASCRPLPDGSVRIDVDILVAAESTKRIVIGAGGAQVAAISRAARSELEAAWGHPVHLSLRVQVDK